MRSFITKGRLFATIVAILLLTGAFLAGARQGYEIGYNDGEKTANGWWIDKKSRYYESAEVKKKRINLKFNQI